MPTHVHEPLFRMEDIKKKELKELECLDDFIPRGQTMHGWFYVAAGFGVLPLCSSKATIDGTDTFLEPTRFGHSFWT